MARRLLAGIALGAVVGLAACGSDDEGTGGSGGTGNASGAGGSGGGSGGSAGAGGTGATGGSAGSGGQVITDPNVTGEQKIWHAITVSLEGPPADESDSSPNPFLDFDLRVTFTGPSSQTYVVPGYFAADGNAAETSATAGNVWRARFTPDEEGLWSYSVSFEEGEDIAVDDAAAGTAVTGDGTSGQFSIGPTDKLAPDLRYHGALRYVGKHHLQFAGSQQHFLKGGADSPENFLAFGEFDGTTDTHQYAPHAADWKDGAPSWQGGKGKNIIGALSYLGSKGVNSIYFLTMNVTGDGDDVWPWTAKSERVHFDVSKLEQWDIVFSHMDSLGIAMHVVTQETENDQLLNGGDLGDDRKLYYRELIARFAHHPAVFWNLGEENTNTDAQRKAFASYIREVDAYDHAIVVHTYPGDKDAVYTPLLGFGDLEGPSLQNGGVSQTHATTIQWLDASAAAGRPWYVALDEIGPANAGVVPDADDPDHDVPRIEGLWGNLMAGGSGAEWYFGYQYAHNDLNLEDFRSRDAMWDQTRHALELFQEHVPFWEMSHQDALASGGADWVLAKPGDTYVVFLKSGGTGSLDLEAHSGSFDVRWFDPRSGGALQTGSVAEVTGPGVVDLGSAPSATSGDWAVFVKKK